MAFGGYGTRNGLYDRSGSNASPDQYLYNKKKTMAIDPYSGHRWSARTGKWTDPEAPKKSRYFSSPKKKLGKISNFDWLLYHYAQRKPTGFEGFGYSNSRTGERLAAQEILNRFGFGVDRIPPGELNKMLAVRSEFHKPMHSNLINPDAAFLKNKYYEKKYGLGVKKPGWATKETFLQSLYK